MEIVMVGKKWLLMDVYCERLGTVCRAVLRTATTGMSVSFCHLNKCRPPKV